jgi:integrase
MQDRFGTYYLRIILTDDLRQRMGITPGQGEYRRSLGTKSKREAVRRLSDAFAGAMSSNRPTAAKNANSGRKPTQVLSTLLVNHTKNLELTKVLASTISLRAYAVGLLLKHVGDKPVDLYSKEDARKLRDALAATPKKGSVDQNISITTVNNILSQVITFFNWAEREGYVPDNVFKGLKVKVKRLQSSFRREFTPEDLAKIFAHKETRLDRSLVPYIALYTACRISEAVQLSKEDIYQVDGIWCFHIRAEKPYQRLKNSASERIIPVHSALLKIGLLDLCASAEDRLFPDAKSAAISQWFGGMLKKLDIGPNKTFHSFRHTGANIMKQHGVDVSLAAALLGHSTNTMTYDRYGKSLKPRALIGIVELITLEGDML